MGRDRTAVRCLTQGGRVSTKRYRRMRGHCAMYSGIKTNALTARAHSSYISMTGTRAGCVCPLHRHWSRRRCPLPPIRVAFWIPHCRHFFQRCRRITSTPAALAHITRISHLYLKLVFQTRISNPYLKPIPQTRTSPVRNSSRKC